MWFDRLDEEFNFGARAVRDYLLWPLPTPTEDIIELLSVLYTHVFSNGVSSPEMLSMIHLLFEQLQGNTQLDETGGLLSAHVRGLIRLTGVAPEQLISSLHQQIIENHNADNQTALYLIHLLQLHEEY